MKIDKHILVVGDIHLGVNKNNPLFFDTALKYADWISNICKKTGIKTIIQLGDIFHNREMVHVPTMNCANEFLTKLQDYQIHITVGNHDSLLNETCTINSLKLLNPWPNITIHEKVTVIDDVCFCGWGTRLEDIPDNNKIIFGHFDIKGFMMNGVKVSDHGFTANDLMKKCKMLISGHYHKHQERLYNKKPLIYSGSAYQLNWGESGESKYCFIVDTQTLKYRKIENKISPKFEYIKNDDDFSKVSNNIVSVEVDDVQSLDTLITKLKNHNALDIKTTMKPIKFLSDADVVDDLSHSNENFTIIDAVEEYVSNNLTNLEKEDLVLIKDTILNMIKTIS